jgi:hypothetical protein
MAAIPILSGVYTDGSPDLRTSYPVNLIPTPHGSGISEYYLRPADGIVAYALAVDDAICRGGINWNGTLYRVLADQFVSVANDGTITILGYVANDGKPVTFDYSFDTLGIASAGNLYFWDGSTLQQNTDPDLGTVVDMCWVDGYWMTTDGEFLIVTELADKFAVDPLKYGSSEADPDPVLALVKLRNEVYAINRYTIEVFDNVGGAGFPFQRIDGAQIQKGAIGTHAACVFMEQIAFVGGGRNEQPSIYIGSNATAQKISTQDIDDILSSYTEDQLSTVEVEYRNDRSHLYLYVHLPDQTLVYDGGASQALQTPVWFILTSSRSGLGIYKARHFVWHNNRWTCGDPSSALLGYLTDTTARHWGSHVRWQFGTLIAYNEGRGAIFNELELVAITGRNALGTSPTIGASYSLDGITWSQERSISAGENGNRNKRLLWTRQGFMRNWRVQRFSGDTQSPLTFVRLEAKLEPLNG